MKRFHRRLIGGVLLAMGPLAMASSVSLTSFPPRVMPVLVHVNSLGKVTEVQPSAQLSPRLQRLLASSLRQWISKPAMVDGHPVDSQSIVNVALHATPRRGGRQVRRQFCFRVDHPGTFRIGLLVDQERHPTGAGRESWRQPAHRLLQPQPVRADESFPADDGITASVQPGAERAGQVCGCASQRHGT